MATVLTAHLNQSCQNRYFPVQTACLQLWGFPVAASSLDVEKVTEAVMRQRLPQMTYRVKVGVNPRGLGFANIAFESDSAAETARVALDRVDLSELPLQVCWEPTAHELAESSHPHLATSPPMSTAQDDIQPRVMHTTEDASLNAALQEAAAAAAPHTAQHASLEVAQSEAPDIATPHTARDAPQGAAPSAEQQLLPQIVLPPVALSATIGAARWCFWHEGQEPAASQQQDSMLYVTYDERESGKLERQYQLWRALPEPLRQPSVHRYCNVTAPCGTSHKVDFYRRQLENISNNSVSHVLRLLSITAW